MGQVGCRELNPNPICREFSLSGLPTLPTTEAGIGKYYGVMLIDPAEGAQPFKAIDPVRPSASGANRHALPKHGQSLPD
jgi:hypothetical protein